MYTPNFNLNENELKAKESALETLKENGLLDSKMLISNFKPSNNYLLVIPKGYDTKVSVLAEEALVAQKGKKEEEIKKKTIIVDSNIREEIKREQMVNNNKDSIDKRHHVLAVSSDYRGGARVGDSVLLDINEGNQGQFYDVELWDLELNSETKKWELVEYAVLLAPSHWVIGIFENVELQAKMFQEACEAIKNTPWYKEGIQLSKVKNIDKGVDFDIDKVEE